jgi:segregation and condensation protein A
MTLLLDTLRARGEICFEELFSGLRTRMEVVVTFLAMLELVKVRAIRIVQEELGGPIVIQAAVGLDTADPVALENDEEGQHGT